MSRRRPCRLPAFPAAAFAVLVAAGCSPAGKAELELTPSTVSACHLPVATTVRWDVSGLGLTQARLEVNNIGRPPKLWMIGGSSGTAEAGAWAQDGYTVTLLSANGVVLARRTLTTEVCPGKEWL